MRASASIRLRNGVADDQTRHYVQQAELAAQLMGPLTDDVELLLLKARLNILTDAGEEALPLLESVFANRDELATHVEAEVVLMLGQVNRALTRDQEARAYYLTAAKLFADAGLSERSSVTLTELLAMDAVAQES